MSTTNIFFSKPKFKKNYFCADLHCHTNHSDGISSAEEILKKIRKKRIGVAITDHNEISGCVEIFKKKKETDFVIPGIEVMSKQGFDVLFYFYNLKTLKVFFDKEIKDNRIITRKFRGVNLYKTKYSLEEIVEFRKKYNCVISLAHPFGYSLRAKPLNILEYKHIYDKVDAIEVINGGNTHSLNIKAVELFNQTNCGITGGTDSHSIFTVGDVLTYSKTKNLKGFLDDIKNKKVLVIGKEPILGRSVFFFYYFLHQFLKWTLIKI